MALQPREKKMLKVLGVVAVAAAIALYFVYRPQPTEDPVESQVLPPEEQKETPAASGSTRRSSSGGRSSAGRAPSRGGGAVSSSVDQLSQHTQINDCWSVLDDGIYNITSFIQLYPSYSDAVAPYCGTAGLMAGLVEEDQVLLNTIKSSSSMVANLES